MRRSLFTAAAAIVLAQQSAQALPPEWLRVKKIDISIEKTKIFTGMGMMGTPKVLGTETGLFNQLIDHFSIVDRVPTDADYFKQRYWVDSTYAKGKDSPVLYYICGEATCDGASNTPLINTVAKEIGAYRVALEHRYYGTSQPFKDLSNEHLKYLSMEQALEDLAVFQKYVQETQGLTGKWISIGGSYPGELSAFYRLKHPELVVGALASSAPVLSKANFEEYDRHVAKVTNGECLNAIQAAVAETERRMETPEGKAQVKALFKASDVSNDVDFLYNLADMAGIAAQYGYQNQFCTALTQGMAQGKVVEAYAQIGNKLFEAFGQTSFQDAFESAMNTDPEYYVSWFGYRSWMYQSCTEFGFYQTAYHDPALRARSTRIDEQYHNDSCDRLFGIKTPVDTATTNKNFYEKLFDSTTKNIFFTNGSNDPWSNLSITATSEANPLLKFFVIDGSAHCDDLGSRMSSALTLARDQFKALVADWIK
ncbi:MAG: hypothetical protein JST80_12675 [Bdellovibrionales bacterium]|nr:hypothetical protein [Bdellovibrionales bacterium]